MELEWWMCCVHNLQNDKSLSVYLDEKKLTFDEWIQARRFSGYCYRLQYYGK